MSDVCLAGDLAQGVDLMMDNQPILWYLELTWILGGEMGSSAYASEKVVLAELVLLVAAELVGYRWADT